MEALIITETQLKPEEEDNKLMVPKSPLFIIDQRDGGIENVHKGRTSGTRNLHAMGFTILNASSRFAFIGVYQSLGSRTAEDRKIPCFPSANLMEVGKLIKREFNAFENSRAFQTVPAITFRRIFRSLQVGWFVTLPKRLD